MIYLTSWVKTEENNREREHAAGEQLLFYAVKEEYGLPLLPEMGRKKQGKPYFPRYEGIQFNISHTGNLAVCALGETELGIDIEQIRKVRESMKRRVLTEREQEWMETCTDKEEAFIRLWTLKESYLKATGEGLRRNLAELEFLLEECKGETKISCNQTGFCFYQSKISQTVYLSLCMRGEAVPESWKKLRRVFLK